jgi:K+-transporting ATPase KdpF subunit
MTAGDTFLLVLSIAVCAYLGFALLKAERFR